MGGEPVAAGELIPGGAARPQARDRRSAVPRDQCEATLSATAAAKHTSAAARMAHPALSPPRPVTIQAMATIMHTTAARAKRIASAFIERLFSSYPLCLMSAQYIFTTYRLSRRYPPDKEVLKDISLSFLPGAKIGVLGYNGAGKSTLLRIMAGLDLEFDGQAQLAPGATVGLLEQEPELDPTKNVRGNIEEGVAEVRALLDRFNELSMNYSDETAEELGTVQERIDAVDGWNLDTTLEIAMDALRCPPPDADVSMLSGGERRRVALCRLLLGQPDLLLLDEPTNHLDAESVAWLERHLHDYRGTVVAVTHDRYFLDNVAGWILELDRGRGIPYQGNYSGWLEQKRARLEQESRQEQGRKRTIERELEWVRLNASARRNKPKARLNAYEALLAADSAAGPRLDDVQIHVPAGPRLGDLVVEAEHLRKAYGERVLIDDLSFNLPRGGIVGVIGPNGAGKTTLMRVITGQEQPDSGTFKLGDSVQLAYVDQSRADLDPEKTVWQEISGGADQIKLGERAVNSRAYVAGFNFRGTDQQKKVGRLSGGERNRLHLAKLLRSGGNVILLDEPTNDLDTDTLRALEEALLAFAGCAVVVSHDRWFLDRIATHILAFEGDSQVRWFEGNFEAYETFRREQLGADAERPHRITYKKLVRA
jgi:energy-dependent translational throttle protein EttA